MIAVILNFLTGTLVTLLVGFISKAVAGYFAPPRFQAVAAFSVTLGFRCGTSPTRAGWTWKPHRRSPRRSEAWSPCTGFGTGSSSELPSRD